MKSSIRSRFDMFELKTIEALLQRTWAWVV